MKLQRLRTLFFQADLFIYLKMSLIPTNNSLPQQNRKLDNVPKFNFVLQSDQTILNVYIL